MRKTKLSADELRAIKAHRNGQNKTSAYKCYLMSQKDLDTIKERALRGRVQRFFERPEVIEAVQMSDDDFNEFAKGISVKTKSSDSTAEIKTSNDKLKKAVDALHSLNVAKSIELATREVVKESEKIEQDELKADPKENDVSADQAFFDSLQMSKDRPDEIILTGTARFLLRRAIAEINARAKAIRERIIDPLDKEASAFTQTNLKAVQIGVSILENRTERYLTAMQNNDSIALELLNMSIKGSTINPADYTAPIPATALAVQKEDAKPEKQEPSND